MTRPRLSEAALQAQRASLGQWGIPKPLPHTVVEGAADWDAYEHQPKPREAARGVGVINPKADIEPCACGGEIVVIRRTEAEMTSAITTHAETDQHKAWRRRRKIEAVRP